jgi:glutamine cyclotransferase
MLYFAPPVSFRQTRTMPSAHTLLRRLNPAIKGRWHALLWYVQVGIMLTACGSPNTVAPAEQLPTPQPPQTVEPQKIAYEILATHPHDRSSFTQGLIVDGEVITETSGLYGKSFLLQYHAYSGDVLQRVDLPKDIFAEGITRFHDQLFMLTWHAGKAFVFDAHTLDHQQTLAYSGQGWGITHDGTHLITSNGSDTLSFRHADDFSVAHTLQVTDSQRSWDQLNELEFAHGYIWANVWQVPLILAINPQTGKVEGILDLTELDRANNHTPGQSVLNGIAYDSQRDAYWVTGKLWPNRYLMRLERPKPQD